MQPRPFVGILILLSLLNSGCAAKETGPDAPPPSATLETREASAEIRLPAPSLPGGRMWHYEASGTWDLEASYDVVVSKTATGYLFAAPSEHQLSSIITWDRPWYGPKDAQLNAVESDWSSAFRFFDFPLHDGKRWMTREGGIEVSARQGTVATPLGEETGFFIEGTKEGQTYRYDYAPSVGYFVNFERIIEGAVLYDIRLTKVATAAQWHWFELVGLKGFASWSGTVEPGAQATLDVPADADVISAIGYGTVGTRGALVPPDPSAGGPWTFEGRGCCDERSSWIATKVPAAAGPWQLVVAGDNDDYVGLEARAAKWTSGSVEPSG